MSILRRISEGKPDWLLDNFETHSTMLGAHTPTATIERFPVVLLQSTEAESLDEKTCPFLSDGPERHQRASHWREFVGPLLRVFDIPGSHFKAFDKEIVSRSSHTRQP